MGVVSASNLQYIARKYIGVRKRRPAKFRQIQDFGRLADALNNFDISIRCASCVGLRLSDAYIGGLIVTVLMAWPVWVIWDGSFE